MESLAKTPKPNNPQQWCPNILSYTAWLLTIKIPMLENIVLKKIIPMK